MSGKLWIFPEFLSWGHVSEKTLADTMGAASVVDSKLVKMYEITI